MRPFDLATPASVGEAADLLAENPGARVIAGGTALTVLIKEGVYFPDLLVNLRPLEDELRYIRADDDAIRLGALATLRDLERSAALAKALPTVVECVGEIAGVRVRNSATIGGHLAHADANLDLPPVLAGLEAEVVLTDGEMERSVSVESFLQGYYETAIEPGELVTEIRIPRPAPTTRGVYRKHRYYSSVDWPCVGVAAFAAGEPDDVRDVRVLLSAVSDTAVLRVEGVDAAVDGALTDDAIDAVATLAREQASPVDDIRGSAAYKERMAGVFTSRALEALVGGMAA